VRAAGFDGAPAAAVDASLEVGRVSDEAARADWTSLFVAGGRLAHRAAADAAFDPGLRETAATNTLAVEGFGDAHAPVAARARRSKDAGDAVFVEHLDEP
jgi:hypothetical protein